MLKTKTVIQYEQRTAQYFIENLGNGVELEMVLISSGNFPMGAPEDEEGRNEGERPQHPVAVTSFWMGKYPVTQGQYEAIMGKNPSHFKGDNLPVERVSWYDAVEFCDRLSQYTGKQYRLPSEAEWEYACRAGTTTPFHFGETIISELANYKAEYTYGDGSKGIYRGETTPVGSFEVANAFGLYDMHGNVWEWCVDHWHGNYENAPTNGSAWVEPENKDKNRSRVLRGGSWLNNPETCRSAYRLFNSPDYDHLAFGLRVVCVVGGSSRTLV
nr:formylglycine-generating enzyme family protein [Calothrix rhizosoleniae]